MSNQKYLKGGNQSQKNFVNESTKSSFIFCDTNTISATKQFLSSSLSSCPVLVFRFALKKYVVCSVVDLIRQ